MREWTNALLKKINKPKWKLFRFVKAFKIVFSKAKAVIRFYKYRDNCFQRFQTSGKTSAPSGKRRYIMPKIGVDSFYRICIALIPKISYVFPRIYYILIPNIPIRTVIFSVRAVVHNFLDIFRGFFCRNIKSYYLARFSTYHCKDICIFSSFRSGFLLDKPV